MFGKPVGEFTLRELVEPKYQLILICRHCQNASALDPLQLIAKAGPDAKLETLHFRVRCSRCGRRRVHMMLRYATELPPIGPMGGGTAKRA